MKESEKIESTYHFHGKYTDGKTEKEVIIVLIIYYKSRSYKIKPLNSDYFTFENGAGNYKVWRAELKAIKRAIVFANIEIDLKSES